MPPDAIVFDLLRELINEEGLFNRVVYFKELIIWKLKDPLPMEPEETLAERIKFEDLPLSADRLQSHKIISDILPEPISIQDLYLVVTLSLEHTLPSITSKLRIDRINYNNRRSKLEPPALGVPSTFLAQQIRRDGPGFFFDRPSTATAFIPVTLLHPTFAQFKDDCAEHTPTPADTKLALELGCAMAEIYPPDSEQSRMSAFRNIMSQNGLGMHANLVDGSRTVTDGTMYSKSFCYCLAEGTNEIGSEGTEPIFQAGAYYAHMMADASKKYPKARLPTLLIYLFGALIGFLGAVYTSQPNLQVLVNPLALFSHYTDSDIRNTTVRYVGALRKVIHSLQEHYDNPSTMDSTGDPCFPYPHRYTSLHDGTTCHFTYKSQLPDKLVFFAEADDGNKLCIKFTHTYSKEAHSACAKMEFAPSLRGFEKLPGGWYMVVMDQVDASFVNFTKSHATLALYDHLKEKIAALHQVGLVHGDIRDANILVKGDEHSMLVDFDWAGPMGHARYPLYLNRTDFWRPEGAQDGSLILADHDIEMLDAMFGRTRLE